MDDGSRRRQRGVDRRGTDPSWSNDGSRIVFSRDGLIMTMAAGGGDEQTITKDANVEDLYPVYQPGTEVLAVVRTPVSGEAGRERRQPDFRDILDGLSRRCCPRNDHRGYYEGRRTGRLMVRPRVRGGRRIHKWEFASAPGMTTPDSGLRRGCLDWPAFSPDGELDRVLEVTAVVFSPSGCTRRAFRRRTRQSG